RRLLRHGHTRGAAGIQRGSTRYCARYGSRIEKLAALVPPPMFNLVRYHGILAPPARWRAQIVPASPATGLDSAFHSGCRARPAKPGGSDGGPRSITGSRPEKASGTRPRNYSWAELMRRAFAVLACPRCFGRMRIVGAIHPPEAIRASTGS